MNRCRLSSIAILNALCISLPVVSTPVVFAQAETDQLTIDSVTLSSDGKELGEAREQGALANIFKLQKDLVYQVLRQAGIDPDKLSPGVRATIDKPQTQNAKAFLAFAQGLEALDQRRFAEAEAAFGEAVRMDPGFDVAVELRDAVPRREQDVGEIADAAIKEAGAKESAVALLATPRGEEPAPTLAPESLAPEAEPIAADLLVELEDITENASDQEGESEQQEHATDLQAQASADAQAAAQAAARARQAADRAAAAEAAADTAAAQVTTEQAQLAADAAKTSAADAAAAAAAAELQAQAAAEAAERAAAAALDPATNAVDAAAATALATAEAQAAADAALASAVAAEAAATEAAATKTVGFYSSFLATDEAVSTGPYINFREEVAPKKGETVTIPQQRLGGGSTGFLRSTVDDMGHLGTLAAFRDHEFNNQNPTIDVRLDRHVHHAFPALELGQYTSAEGWQADTEESYDFFSRNLRFAEGVATSPADLAALVSAQTVATYSGVAGADISLDGVLSSCPSCGSFSTVLDFGRSSARDFQLQLDTGQGALSINSTQEVNLGNDGHFFFNNPDAVYQLGSPGALQPANGGVVGGTFGRNAGSVGGSFLLENDPNFAAGNFGGQR